MNNFNIVSTEIEQYISNLLPEEDETLQELVRETNLKHLYPRMLSGKIQGNFLAFLVSLLAPEHVLEIGTYTGYASICIARALRQSAKLDTIEINQELSQIHEKYFKKAGILNKTNCIYGDALEILPQLDCNYDFVFLDADKANYPKYYEQLMPILRPNACLVVDNVLWSGRVVSEEVKDKQLRGIKQFNQMVADDPQSESIILSIRDGLSLIKKKA